MTPILLTFGKHKGQPLNAVPTGYLRWLVDSSDCLNRYGITDAVIAELQARGEGMAAVISRTTKTPIPGSALLDYSGGSLGLGSLLPATVSGMFRSDPMLSYLGSKTTKTITAEPTFLPSVTSTLLPTSYSVSRTAKKATKTDPAPPKTKSPRMNCWDLAKDVLSSGFHVLLHGGIGLGKTTFALQAGLREDEPAYGLTLTDGMTLGDMFGRFWLKSGTSEWVDGPATRALRAGSRLVLNEVEAASGEIMTALHALTDHATIARVALPNGEILSPAQGFRVVMTSNFIPSESLPAPLVDRAICIEIDSPHPDSVAALPEDLRQAATASSIQKDAKRRVSMRAWHHYAVLRTTIGEIPAAQAVFAGRADDILDAFSIRRGPGRD